MAVRESTQELYGVTPERALLPSNRAVNAQTHVDTNNRRASELVRNADNGAMEMAFDATYLLDLAAATLKKCKTIAAAEHEFEFEKARVKARERAHLRRVRRTRQR